MTDDLTPLGRLDELLADRALQGLGPDESDELRDLADDSEADGLALELAAAELALGACPIEEMPDSLRRRIERDAEAHFGRSTVLRPALARVVPWLGWVAAAASILFATEARRLGPPVAEPTRSPTLLERLAGVPVRTLGATDHPLARGGHGDLVWSAERQEGYLTVEGLSEVEPDRGVYQLWIFDASRDERFPVDGGTFTVGNAKAKTVVPIRPSIPVRRPTLFAITLEPPGGVVVSDRKRIVLTATP